MSAENTKYSRENIVMKIADIQQKKEICEDIITDQVMDLTIVYYYTVFRKNNIAVTIPLPKLVLKALDIDKNELYQLALNNTIRQSPPVVMTVEQVLKKGMSLSMRRQYEREKFFADDIYLVTNDIGTGAVYILDKHILDILTVALKDDLAIIPSTSQEILVLAKSNKNLNDWVSTVKVNHEQVFEKDERLSNSVYFYDKDKREFTYRSADEYLNDVYFR